MWILRQSCCLSSRCAGINAMAPKAKKILQLLRLRQIINGVFLKVSKATVNMFYRVEPDVTYGKSKQGFLIQYHGTTILNLLEALLSALL
ncbi:hypothetical protein P3S67_004947 [Capsicum chacoense]